MKQTFLIDDKTLKDTKIKSINERSVFDYFNKTYTEGGQERLLELFNSPTKDPKEIIARQNSFKRYTNLLELEFPFDKTIIKDIHKFLVTPRSHTKSVFDSLNFFRINTPEYFYTKRTVLEVFQVLLSLKHILGIIIKWDSGTEIMENYEKTQKCIDRFGELQKSTLSEKLFISFTNIDSFETEIRENLRDDLLSLILMIYDIDAGLAVIKSKNILKLEFAKITTKAESNTIEAMGLFNIFHKKPVRNNVKITSNKRIWFLTGPNMAGKSSLIKSISIAVYLAHIGFPVPALSFTANALDGLFTSINLEDDSELGHSYFYAEIFRLKEIVEKLDKNSNALIILDELFKGTNEEDASDAIVQIVKNFNLLTAPVVLITSHNTNVYDKLSQYSIVDYFKMDIARDLSGFPVFTYKLVPGIAKDKLGMYLLEKSGLIKTFEKKY
ncbi:hypothetical protein HP439_09440 [Sphingobacterium shayense]|uniref:MutS-related protein n=1 Tax=Sphingobacterium shayense TaxID=626343 RepID=UPI0015538F9A|nr:hypothetical protein [Sphingobacterium shayense]NQD70939.1 hypothetical protein [Sphingobacterium shayense]